MRKRATTAIVLSLAAAATGVRAQTPPRRTDGSLRQHEVAIRLDAARVHMQATPLTESIIRLLTPEAYRALHAIRTRFQDEIDAVASERGIMEPTVFLVAVMAGADDVPFVPDDVAITSRNVHRRPIVIIPLSPQWNRLVLSNRETVSALYVFDAVAVWEPFTVHYGATTSAQWERTLRTLERERNRIPPGRAENRSVRYFTSE